MRVKLGTLEALADFCMRHPKAIAVPQCFHSYKEDWTGNPYGAARFSWKDYGKDENEPQALAGKWRTSKDVGQIPCVMGACYAFRRDWYIDGVRSPWSFGTGWGCDEEILSAATWLRGGTVNLLPLQVWHQAREPGKVPYRLTNRQLYGVWANRLRVIDMLPMSLDDKKELIRHILPALTVKQWGEVNKMNAVFMDEVEAYRQFLATGPMNWSEFREIMEMETIKPMGMKEMRKIAKEKGIIVPFGCKKADLCKMLQSSPDAAPVTEIVEKPTKTKKKMANWGADEINNAGKRCCVHCGGGVTTVTKTMRAGRLIQRYRNFYDCGKNFPTREIVTTL
jgi:hypothetical protein